LKFFIQLTPVLGRTDEEAQAKLAEHLKYHDAEGSLVQFSGIAGLDLSKFPIDEEFPTDPKHPLFAGLAERQIAQLTTKLPGHKTWTPRDFARTLAVGGSGVTAVGSPRTVADEIERWIDEADIDGLNIGHLVVPQAWEDVIELLIPELERRGWFDGHAVGDGATARENVYGTPGEPQLRANHPGKKWAFDVYPDGHGSIVGGSTTK
jgi:alkanesulfonate monooxygenase SsuD/methylene tetrahydromethanopterin reductase-like flavin-dependent oxidoreductase (luciferase family)